MLTYFKDRSDVISCWWELSCFMHFSALTGGCQNSYMLGDIMTALDNYQTALDTLHAKIASKKNNPQ